MIPSEPTAATPSRGIFAPSPLYASPSPWPTATSTSFQVPPSAASGGGGGAASSSPAAGVEARSEHRRQLSFGRSQHGESPQPSLASRLLGSPARRGPPEGSTTGAPAEAAATTPGRDRATSLAWRSLERNARLARELSEQREASARLSRTLASAAGQVHTPEVPPGQGLTWQAEPVAREPLSQDRSMVLEETLLRAASAREQLAMDLQRNTFSGPQQHQQQQQQQQQRRSSHEHTPPGRDHRLALAAVKYPSPVQVREIGSASAKGVQEMADMLAELHHRKLLRDANSRSGMNSLFEDSFRSAQLQRSIRKPSPQPHSGGVEGYIDELVDWGHAVVSRTRSLYFSTRSRARRGAVMAMAQALNAVADHHATRPSLLKWAQKIRRRKDVEQARQSRLRQSLLVWRLAANESKRLLRRGLSAAVCLAHVRREHGLVAVWSEWTRRQRRVRRSMQYEHRQQCHEQEIQQSTLRSILLTWSCYAKRSSGCHRFAVRESKATQHVEDLLRLVWNSWSRSAQTHGGRTKLAASKVASVGRAEYSLRAILVTWNLHSKRSRGCRKYAASEPERSWHMEALLRAILLAWGTHARRTRGFRNFAFSEPTKTWHVASIARFCLTCWQLISLREASLRAIRLEAKQHRLSAILGVWKALAQLWRLQRLSEDAFQRQLILQSQFLTRRQLHSELATTFKAWHNHRWARHRFSNLSHNFQSLLARSCRTSSLVLLFQSWLLWARRRGQHLWGSAISLLRRERRQGCVSHCFEAWRRGTAATRSEEAARRASSKSALEVWKFVTRGEKTCESLAKSMLKRQTSAGIQQLAVEAFLSWSVICRLQSNLRKVLMASSSSRLRLHGLLEASYHRWCQSAARWRTFRQLKRQLVCSGAFHSWKAYRADMRRRYQLGNLLHHSNEFKATSEPWLRNRCPTIDLDLGALVEGSASRSHTDLLTAFASPRRLTTSQSAVPRTPPRSMPTSVSVSHLPKHFEQTLGTPRANAWAALALDVTMGQAFRLWQHLATVWRNAHWTSAVQVAQAAQARVHRHFSFWLRATLLESRRRKLLASARSRLLLSVLCMWRTEGLQSKAKQRWLQLAALAGDRRPALEREGLREVYWLLWRRLTGLALHDRQREVLHGRLCFQQWRLFSAEASQEKLVMRLRKAALLGEHLEASVVGSWERSRRDRCFRQCFRSWRRCSGVQNRPRILQRRLTNSYLRTIVHAWQGIQLRSSGSLRFWEERKKALQSQLELSVRCFFATWKWRFYECRKSHLSAQTMERSAALRILRRSLVSWQLSIESAARQALVLQLNAPKAGGLPQGPSSRQAQASCPDELRERLAIGRRSLALLQWCFPAWGAVGRKLVATRRLERALARRERRICGAALRSLAASTLCRLLGLSGASHRLDMVMARMQASVRVQFQSWYKLTRSRRMAASLLALQLQHHFEKRGTWALGNLLAHARRRIPGPGSRVGECLGSLRDRSGLLRVFQHWFGVSLAKAQKIRASSVVYLVRSADFGLAARVFWHYRRGVAMARDAKAAVERADLLTERTRLRMLLKSQKRDLEYLQGALGLKDEEVRQLISRSSSAKEKLNKLLSSSDSDPEVSFMDGQQKLPLSLLPTTRLSWEASEPIVAPSEPIQLRHSQYEPQQGQLQQHHQYPQPQAQQQQQRQQHNGQQQSPSVSPWQAGYGSGPLALLAPEPLASEPLVSTSAPKPNTFSPAQAKARTPLVRTPSKSPQPQPPPLALPTRSEPVSSVVDDGGGGAAAAAVSGRPPRLLMPRTTAPMSRSVSMSPTLSQPMSRSPSLPMSALPSRSSMARSLSAASLGVDAGQLRSRGTRSKFSLPLPFERMTPRSLQPHGSQAET